MAKFNWTGVIREGILKMKLAFDENVDVEEREKIMERCAEEVSHSDIYVLESQHFDKMSSLKAVIKRPRK